MQPHIFWVHSCFFIFLLPLGFFTLSLCYLIPKFFHRCRNFSVNVNYFVACRTLGFNSHFLIRYNKMNILVMNIICYKKWNISCLYKKHNIVWLECGCRKRCSVIYVYLSFAVKRMETNLIPHMLIMLIMFISFYCWTLIWLLSPGWVKHQTPTIRAEIDGAFLPLGLRAYCVTFLNEKWRWGRNETQRGGTSHGGGCRHDSSTSPHRPHLSYQQHPALRRGSGQGLLRRKADKGR